jgi:UDP-3-O-[3-hydroxymyristoyl] glucosamine N-acyltransferase
MRYRIDEIAQALGAEAAGDLALTITRAAEPASAGPDDLALALTPAYGAAIGKGAARAALLWPGADWQAMGLQAAIFAPRGRLAMARLTGLLAPPLDIAPGVHPTAVIDPTAELGRDLSVGPYVVINAGARIGDGCRIAAHVTIGSQAVIGAGGIIHAGVRIGAHVRIGARVFIRPNAIIGADGFSFVTATPSHAEIARVTMGRGTPPVLEDATWHRIHSLGGVEIGDDVDIGGGTCVDAGTIRPTQIGSGTKIDNMVQIAHNVIIGRDCLLAGQTGLAGSAVLGDRVVLGGKAAVGDNLTVGDDAVITGATMVMSSVPAGRVMMGSPAVRMDQQVEMYKALRRLPRWMSRQKAVPNPDQTE